MSDYENDRPSKRVRRDSRSRSPDTLRERRKNDERERGRYTRDRDRDERQRSDYKHRRRQRSNEGDRRARSLSPADDKGHRHASERRHRHRDDRSRRHRSRSRSRDRSTSPRRERHKHRRNNSRDRHRSKDRDKNRHQNRNQTHRSLSLSPLPHQRSKAPLPSQTDAFTSTSDPNQTAAPTKQKPNFQPTGKLAALSNTVQTHNQTIVLKYHEPTEARKPPSNQRWRIYVFKDDDILDTLELSEQSCWLFGREAAVVDYPVEHPSCSKQHAVVQFRYVETKNEFGDRAGRVKPYLIDLESVNGTSVNGERVPEAKYVELRDKDVVRFGESLREYVIQLPPDT